MFCLKESGLDSYVMIKERTGVVDALSRAKLIRADNGQSGELSYSGCVNFISMMGSVEKGRTHRTS